MGPGRPDYLRVRRWRVGASVRRRVVEVRNDRGLRSYRRMPLHGNTNRLWPSRDVQSVD